MKYREKIGYTVGYVDGVYSSHLNYLSEIYRTKKEAAMDRSKWERPLKYQRLEGEMPAKVLEVYAEYTDNK